MQQTDEDKGILTEVAQRRQEVEQKARSTQCNRMLQYNIMIHMIIELNRY
jgi:hypothetical protein